MTRYVEDAPAAVLAAAKTLLRKGLVEGTSGNISARQEDGTVVITPSSLDYEVMEIEDLVVIDLDGEVVSSPRDRYPSSEKPLHLACYQAFDDVGSVIHSHAIFATMFAVARQPIPACIDEFSIYVGGEVRCADYAASGEAELGKAIVAALEGRGAALMANHGLVAVAPNPAKALHITALVERSAQIVHGAKQLGQAFDLPEEVNAKFGTIYGYLRKNPM